jgi:hypothetical protein
MAIYPKAVKRLIPPGSNDPRIKPRVAILHVDAGNNRDLHDYFAYRSGGIESHFQIALDGTVFQYRDTEWEADANHKANPFAVSIETQGLAEGEWTPAQLVAIRDLLRWLRKVHKIPLRKCPKWDGKGVGYHIQFGAPGAWTPSAKSCPGPQRIQQFDHVLMPMFGRRAERSTRGPRIDRALSALLGAHQSAEKKGHGFRAQVTREAIDALQKLKGRRKR